MQSSATDAAARRNYDRYLRALYARPRFGPTLDRVMAFHEARGTLDSFADELREAMSTNAESRAGDDRPDSRFSAAMTLGLIHFSRRQFEAAADAFDAAAASAPENAWALWYHGKALASARRADSAAAVMQKAVALSMPKSDRHQLLSELAAVLTGLGRGTEAAEVWDLLLAEYPDDAELLQKSVDALLHLELFDEALQRTDRMISLATGPEDQVAARLTRADVLNRAGRSEEALQLMLSQLENIRPGSWLHDDISLRAELLMSRLSGVREVRDWYQSRFRRDSTDLTAARRAADLLNADGGHAAAAEYLQAVVQAQPEDFEAVRSLIGTLAAAGEREAAKRLADEQLRLHPDDLAFADQFCRLLSTDSSGSDEQRNAQVESTILTALNSGQATLQRTLTAVSILEKYGLLSAAGDLLVGAAESSAEDAAALQDLADELLLRGFQEEAVEVYRGLAEAPDSSAEILQTLAELLEAGGGADEALSLRRELFRRSGRSEDLLALTRSMVQNGSAEEAAELISAQIDSAADADRQQTLLAEKIRILTAAGQIADRLRALGRSPAESEVEAVELFLGLAAVGQPGDAVRKARQAVEQFPQGRLTLNAALELFERSSLPLSAAEIAGRLAEIDPRRRVGYLKRLAAAQAAAGDEAEALRTAEELFRAGPANRESMNCLVQLFLAQGRTKDAIATLEQHGRAAVPDAATLILQAQLLGAEFRTQDAVDAYATALQRSGDLIQQAAVARQLALLLNRQGRMEQLRGLIAARRITEETTAETDTDVLVMIGNDAAGRLSLSDVNLIGSQISRIVESSVVDGAPGTVSEYLGRFGDQQLFELVVKSPSEGAPGRRASPVETRPSIGRESERADSYSAVIERIETAMAGGDLKTAARIAGEHLPKCSVDAQRWPLLYVLGIEASVSNQQVSALQHLRDLQTLKLPFGTTVPGLRGAAGAPGPVQREEDIPAGFSALSPEIPATLRLIVAPDRITRFVQSRRMPVRYGEAALIALHLEAGMELSSPESGERIAERHFVRTDDAVSSDSSVADFFTVCRLIAVLRSVQVSSSSSAADAVLPSLLQKAEELTSEIDIRPDSINVVSLILLSEFTRSAIGTEKAMQAVESTADRIPEFLLLPHSRSLLSRLAVRIQSSGGDQSGSMAARIIRSTEHPVGLLVAASIAAELSDAAGFTEACRKLARIGGPLPQSASVRDITDELPRLMARACSQAVSEGNAARVAALAESFAMLKSGGVLTGTGGGTTTDAIHLSVSSANIGYQIFVPGQPSEQLRTEVRTVRWPVPDEMFSRADLGFLVNLAALSETASVRVAVDDVFKIKNHDAGGVPEDVGREHAVRRHVAAAYLFLTGRPELSLQHLGLALQLDPDSAALRITAAIQLTDLQFTDDAVNLLLEAHPTSAQQRFRREALLLKIGSETSNRELTRQALNRLRGMRLSASELQFIESLSDEEVRSSRVSVAEESSVGTDTAEFAYGVMESKISDGDKSSASEAALEVLYRLERKPAASATTADRRMQVQALEVLHKSGRLSEMTATLAARVAASPTPQPDDLERLADYLRAAGRAEEADTVLNRLVPNPQNAGQTLAAARFFARRGRTGRACDLYLQAFRDDIRLFQEDYYSTIRTFTTERRLNELTDALLSAGVEKMGSTVLPLMQLIETLLRDERTREQGYRLFVSTWKAFPAARTQLIGNVTAPGLWLLPEMFEELVRRVIPATPRMHVSPWDGLAAGSLPATGSDSDDGVLILLRRLRTESQVAQVRQEIADRLEKFPKWSGGRFLLLLAESAVRTMETPVREMRALIEAEEVALPVRESGVVLQALSEISRRASPETASSLRELQVRIADAAAQASIAGEAAGHAATGYLPPESAGQVAEILQAAGTADRALLVWLTADREIRQRTEVSQATSAAQKLQWLRQRISIGLQLQQAGSVPHAAEIGAEVSDELSTVSSDTSGVALIAADCQKLTAAASEETRAEDLIRWFRSLTRARALLLDDAVMETDALIRNRRPYAGEAVSRIPLLPMQADERAASWRSRTVEMLSEASDTEGRRSAVRRLLREILEQEASLSTDGSGAAVCIVLGTRWKDSTLVEPAVTVLQRIIRSESANLNPIALWTAAQALLETDSDREDGILLAEAALNGPDVRIPGARGSAEDWQTDIMQNYADLLILADRRSEAEQLYERLLDRILPQSAVSSAPSESPEYLRLIRSAIAQ